MTPDPPVAPDLPVTPDLEVVAAAALGSPVIAGLTGGRFGEVATYLPGRRILGIRAVEGEIELHVVARWDIPLPEVADAVRAAVAPYTGAMPVAVFVDDIEVSDGVTDSGSGGDGTVPQLEAPVQPGPRRPEEAGVAGP